MTTRRLPVRPRHAAIERQASELFEAILAGQQEARAEFARHAPDHDGGGVTLDDARLVVARAHQAARC